MKKLAAILLLSFGCAPPAYYVSTMYKEGPNLYVERCAIDNGRYRDKPDPQNCKLEEVGPLPASLVPLVHPTPAVATAP